MKATHKRVVFGFITLVIAFFSLLNSEIAFADDDPPPTPTEEPVQPSIEEAIGTETPTQDDAAETEILLQIPEGTDLVVLNESGQPEPLVMQEALETVQNGDPIWCKENIAPDPADVANCTGSYTSLQDLLDYLAINQPTENGTIWIEDNYDSSVNDSGINDFTIDGAILTTWATHTLRVQGGWDGASGSTDVNAQDPSMFNGASLNIINWGNTVTINNIIVQNTNSDGLTVTTSGDIVLSNVQANTNNGLGANLDNTNGNGNVKLTGKNSFKNNASLGLYLSSCGNISISNLSANNNDSGAAIGNSCNGNFGLETITLLGKNSFSSNNTFGLYVQSKGDITLQNISANANGFFGAVVDNCNWDPNTQGCAGTGNIIISRAVFNGNASGALAGLTALSNGSITLNNITASNNTGDGIYLEMGQPSTVNFACIKNNDGYGIVSFGGNLTLKGVTSIGNYYDDIRMLNGSLISNPGPNNCLDGQKEVDSYLPIHYVDVAGGETVELDCQQFSGTVLILPNEDSAYFPCPLGESASLTSNTKNDLTSSFPSDVLFHSGFTVSLSEMNTDQSKLDQFIRISFRIPAGVDISSLAILFWDGTEWVELTEDLELNGGRKVAASGFISADGLYFEALVNFTGTFVLIQK